MKIHSVKLGISSAITFAVLWVVCSVLVMALPDQTMSITASMLHANQLSFNWDLGASGLVVGLLAWSAVAGLAGLLVGCIYNSLNKGGEL